MEKEEVDARGIIVEKGVNFGAVKALLKLRIGTSLWNFEFIFQFWN